MDRIAPLLRRDKARLSALITVGNLWGVREVGKVIRYNLGRTISESYRPRLGEAPARSL